MAAPTIGVLALQGAFRAHVERLRSLEATTLEVRTLAQLGQVDALVLPGGESTTMSNLLATSSLYEPVAERLTAGMPVFGTCAGLILLARTLTHGRPDQRHFGVLDVAVERNGFGRQLASFEAPVRVDGLDAAFHGVFIRAPRITGAGAGVEVLGTVDAGEHAEEPVVVRAGSVLASSFHPELTPDPRLHRVFLDLVAGS